MTFPAVAEDAPPPEPRLFVQEYRVEGVGRLPAIDVERAVYPYLGPGRTREDVEKARLALENTYHQKGYQTVAVEVPPQKVRDGVVFLKVTEATVGRLRVTGARYFSPVAIKEAASSLAEGTLPDFEAVKRDIVGLNQSPDRRVTPSLVPGHEPGTVDVELAVKDKLPLHGSIELNNRYSANTTSLRLNGAVDYDNLWQRGHTLGFSFQIAPERIDDAKVFSGYYLMRPGDIPWLSLMLQGTLQDSDISTLVSGGDAASSAGHGSIVGLHAVVALPSTTGFFQSLNLGFDYKHFDQSLRTGSDELLTPVTYLPLTLVYSSVWNPGTSTTALNLSAVLNFRGVGSDEKEFANRRSGSSGGFAYLRADLTHTRPIFWGFEMMGSLQGQLADRPLLDTEQFSIGGLTTVRGYLESEQVGDTGVVGSLELRSPEIHFGSDEWINSFRLHAFADGGVAIVREPLPQQHDDFSLASIGLGMRLKVRGHYSGSFDAALPLISQPDNYGNETDYGDVRYTFRIGAEF